MTISARISSRTFSWSSMSFKSASMSLVPMTFVPLNIMCSKKWLRPVMPGRSFTEPTRAVQPAATVGDSWRSKSSHFIPLPSTTSVTSIWGFSAAWSDVARKARPSSMPVRFGRFMDLDL